MTQNIQKIVSWKSTYASREIVLVGTDRETAEKWAAENSRGWTLRGISAVRGTDNRNFTVKFGK